MALSDVIRTSLENMYRIAKTETVVGEPIVAGEVTLIPVSRVSIGFAAGGAGKEEKLGSGGGSGGGVSVTPVAFLVVTGEKVQVQPIEPSDPVMQKIMAMAPDVINHVADYFISKNKDKKAAKKKKKEKENHTDTDSAADIEASSS
jgi:sporulation protein YtfJ